MITSIIKSKEFAKTIDKRISKLSTQGENLLKEINVQAKVIEALQRKLKNEKLKKNVMDELFDKLLFMETGLGEINKKDTLKKILLKVK